VLLKAGRPFTDAISPLESLERMHGLNPGPQGKRPLERLCAGQTLLCRALDLQVSEWNRRTFDPATFFVEDVGYVPRRLIQARRLGIPMGRDEHLPYRFIDFEFVRSATSNPLTKRRSQMGRDFRLLARRRPAGAKGRLRAKVGNA
jgi:DNA-3-methyladenine glycosylase